jgi:hypothetical protein
MTRSGCTARVPCFTVVSKSVDRVIRFRAESTAVTPEFASSSQRTTALAPPVRHDRPPCPGAHAQPEAVHAGSAPVVRLEGPLALCHDSLLVTSGIVPRPGGYAGGTRLPSRSLGRLCVSLETGAGPVHVARIAAVSPTFGRLDEGTDDRSPGQTWSSRYPTRWRYLTIATPATPVREQFQERTAQCCRTVGAGEENC